MITLYIKTGCPFCARVIATVDAYEIPCIQKNIADEGVLDELESLGGKRQAPFMVDEDTMMYESDAIIAYLEGKFQQEGQPKRPRIHYSSEGDVCPS